MKVLIISTVWVEPNSSAAGSRMLQLIRFFQRQHYTIEYASTAAPSEFAMDLSHINVPTRSVEVNSTSFDDFLKDWQPDMVLFDRFMTEEQFGWRVRSICPRAVHILDTEDLHCLRKAREAARKKGTPDELDLYTDEARREVASIFRCDLSLMISEAEIDVLISDYSVSEKLLHYIPFLVDVDKATVGWNAFVQRSGFVSIGNFLHGPNWDATLFLKQEIWPLIRKRLPNAELNVYGAYPSQKVFDLHDEANGFLVHGRADDALKVISESKILLAPLRYGAGQKGKLLDAFKTGTPSVTTTIGIEGMGTANSWPGYVEDDPKRLADQAVALYTDETDWMASQSRIPEALNKFDQAHHEQSLLLRLEILFENLEEERESNFIGSMLNYHTMRSTEFMSRWIEEKNRNQSR